MIRVMESLLARHEAKPVFFAGKTKMAPWYRGRLLDLAS